VLEVALAVAKKYGVQLRADSPENAQIFASLRQLADYIAASFRSVGLDERNHVESDPSFFRPSEIKVSAGNPTAAKENIGWQATMHMPDVAAALVRHELERQP